MQRIGMVLVMVLGCSGGDDGGGEASDEPATVCERLRDHVIDVRLTGAAAPGVDRAAHRAALRSALGDDFVARCERALTPPQIECAMAALDDEAVAACTAAAR